MEVKVKKDLYLGYSRRLILEMYRKGKDETDKNGRIGSVPTLEMLANASKDLVNDNKDKLTELFENLK